MMAGVLCCLVAFGVDLLCDELVIPFIASLMEEVLKCGVAVLFMRRVRITFLAEAQCYGAAIGGGFALLENVIYVFYNSDILLATVLFRGMGTAMLHMGCTALFLTLMLISRYRYGVEKGVRRYLAFVTVLPGMLLHELYNLHLLSPLLQLFLVVAFFLLLFVGINRSSEQRVSRWLDHSMNSDIELLAALREGTFAETRAGRYIMAVRNQFDAEVYFDMVCYVQLYLELIVAGKSRIMLREAGLSMQETKEERAVRKEKIKELRTLQSRIGVMGEIILKPIVRLTRENWKIIG